MDLLTETRDQSHIRFKEVVSTDVTRRISRTTLPWLPREEPETLIRLALVTRRDNTQFYIGNVIRGRLVEIAQNVGANNLDIEANNIFYATIEKFLDGCRMIGRISNPKSDRDIHYDGNRRGVRVYFMKLDPIEGRPVIIRIGICHSKGMEERVFKEIASQSAQQIHRSLY